MVHECALVVEFDLANVGLEGLEDALMVVRADLAVDESVDHLRVRRVSDVDLEVGWAPLADLYWCLYDCGLGSLPPRREAGLSVGQRARRPVLLPHRNDIVQHDPAVVATGKDFVNLTRTQLNDMLKFRLTFSVLAEAELPVLAISSSIQITLLGQGEAMVPPSSDHTDGTVQEVKHLAWRESILVGAMAELTVASRSKGVETATVSQHHAVVTTSRNLAHKRVALKIIASGSFFGRLKVIRELDALRSQDILLGAIATLAELVTAPSVDVRLGCDGDGVIAAAGNLSNTLISEVLDLHRHFDVLEVTVPTLAFVVRAATSTPGEDTALAVKGNGVEVATGHLLDPSILVDQGLDRLRNTSTGGFLMQAAAPGIDDAFLGQGKVVVIATCDLSDAHFRLGDLDVARDIGLVELNAELAMQGTSADVDLAGFGYENRVMRTSVDAFCGMEVLIGDLNRLDVNDGLSGRADAKLAVLVLAKAEDEAL